MNRDIASSSSSSNSNNSNNIITTTSDSISSVTSSKNAIRKAINDKYLKHSQQLKSNDSCVVMATSSVTNIRLQQMNSDKSLDESELSDAELKALKRQQELDEKYGG